MLFGPVDEVEPVLDIFLEPGRFIDLILICCLCALASLITMKTLRMTIKIAGIKK